MKGRQPIAPPSGTRRGWSAADAPARPRGTPTTGRIVKLSIGQGFGFIRVAEGPDVYFHRGDVSERTPFNRLAVGDAVVFELVEDRFSGPRALQVDRPRP